MIIWRPKHEIKKRSKDIRKDFYRLYKRGDGLREQLFREQEGVCAICGGPMLDCVVDHAIPVYCYAIWDFSIKEAARHANAKRNLLAVHFSCNSAKSHADFEDFMDGLHRGEIVLGEPRPVTASKRVRALSNKWKKAHAAGMKKAFKDPEWRRMWRTAARAGVHLRHLKLGIKQRYCWLCYPPQGDSGSA